MIMVGALRFLFCSLRREIASKEEKIFPLTENTEFTEKKGSY